MFFKKIAKKHFRKYNKKVHTEADAVEFCKSSELHIVETDIVNFGKYIKYKGEHFLLINPFLSAAMRLWVLWHEIGHFLFHAPETSDFSTSMVSKTDREANWFAAVMLMPQGMLKSKKRICNIEEDFGYPRELIEIRKYISDNEKE